jgi:hypothetical protein
MIGVAVSHEDSGEPCRVTRQLIVELRHVTWMANTRIDEDGLAIGSDEQVRVVAAAGHRAGVVSLEQDREHR